MMQNAKDRFFSAGNMKKKLIRFLAIALSLLTFAALMTVVNPAPVYAAATKENAVSFTVKKTLAGGDVKYVINVSDVYAGDTYQSFTITYPKQMLINIPAAVSDVWNVTQNVPETDSPVVLKSATFAIKAGQAARTPALLKSDLQNIYFTLVSPNVSPPAKSKVSIIANATKIAFFTDSEGYVHYYEYYNFKTETGTDGVSYTGDPASEGKYHTWLECYNFAKGKTYTDSHGKVLQGYLATITTREEQLQIYNAIATRGGWLGGTRMVFGAAENNNVKIQDQNSISTTINEPNYDFTSKNAPEWYWADGPEAWTTYDAAAGTYTKYPKGTATVLATGGPVTPLVFFKNSTYEAGTDHKVKGVYEEFNNPENENYLGYTSSKHPADYTWSATFAEPNGGGNGNNSEYCLQFAFTNGDMWNDYSYNSETQLYGYYVEYGGYVGDPKVSDLGGSDIVAPSGGQPVPPIIVQSQPPIEDIKDIEEEADLETISSGSITVPKKPNLNPAKGTGAGDGAGASVNILTELEKINTAGLRTVNSWAFLNLILAAVSIVLALIALLTNIFIWKKREEDEDFDEVYVTHRKRKILTPIISAVFALINVIVFLVMEDTTYPMRFADIWSILMVIILIFEVIFVLIALRRKEVTKVENIYPYD